MEATVAKKKKVVTDELEWKAEWFHKRAVQQMADKGFHSPEFHLDPMKVAPRRLPDGKSFCTHCHLALGDYKDLSEARKDELRALVAAVKLCDSEYKKA